MSDQRYSGRLADMLRCAYLATHDENVQLGCPDHEQMAVLQLLRINIVPAEHVSENFEFHLQRTIAAPGVPAVNHYRPELRRFRRFTANQRAALFEELMIAEGHIWDEGRWSANPEGFGELDAFAYDHLTGGQIIRSGIGVHYQVLKHLYEQVRPLELGARWPLDPGELRRDMLKRMEEMIAGFIITLPNWRTPFLHLWEKEPGVTLDHWLISARTIQQQQLFLVAQRGGDPIPFRVTR